MSDLRDTLSLSLSGCLNRDAITPLQLNDAVNAAVLAMDGQITRKNARLVTVSVAEALGLTISRDARIKQALKDCADSEARTRAWIASSPTEEGRERPTSAPDIR